MITAVLVLSCRTGPSGSPCDGEKLREYHAQLEELRNEFRSYELPEARFFLFGMGNRPKLIYSGGQLISAFDGTIVRTYDVHEDLILPNAFRVRISTTEGEKICIYENEKGIYIDRPKAQEILFEGEDLILPAFEGHRFSEVLKVLHHEVLVNIEDGLPLPNYLVYRKPWRRDAAMMAMVLERTGNLGLIREWVLGLDEVYDYNNKSGGVAEEETDNLGQTLYLISLFADRDHPLVPEILLEAQKWEREINGVRYLHGRTDFAEVPVFQTKWMKFGLHSLGLPDPYGIPDFGDAYSTLFWWDYPEFENSEGAWVNDYYPYIGWARDHFYGTKSHPVSTGNYPLTWEIRASQADYEGIRIIGNAYADGQCAAPHTWHAAEMFLYLLKL